MDREAAYRAEYLFNQLEKYKTPKYQATIQELRNIVQPIIDNERDKEMKSKHLEKYSYGNYTPVKRISQTIGNLNQAISHYEEAAHNLEKTQKSTQDILHAIELLDLTEDEILGMAKELHDIRKIRREAKDFTELMLPFYDFACTLRSNGVLSQLNQILKDAQQETARKENRKYNPREKTELTEAFEQIGAGKER